MSSFSERYGYVPVQTALQRECLSPKLRVGLWNALKIFLWDKYTESSHNQYAIREKIDSLVSRLWMWHMKQDLDALPSPGVYLGSYDLIKNFYMNSKWNHAYDFLEFVFDNSGGLIGEVAFEFFNAVFESNGSAYRVVNGVITEITSETDISAIEEGLALPHNPVRTHLRQALSMLSDRDEPDYRNSVKESISAVEAACRSVAGDPKATLNDALKKVRSIHPALSQAFGKLYGYTNDQPGVRHSLTEMVETTHAEAKFMLVASSAFVAYLFEASST